jgi:hypothetical protein
MIIDPPVARFLLLLALGFFFGLAFEEFHADSKQARPGGIRSFPLLALSGALLYRLDPGRLLALSVGLLVLGAWLTCCYWRHVSELDADGRPECRAVGGVARRLLTSGGLAALSASKLLNALRDRKRQDPLATVALLQLIESRGTGCMC